ncbi:MAG: hydrolase [Acidobacteriota bacterium]
MKHSSILDPGRSALAVVDLQEAFRPVIAGFDELAHRIALLVEGVHSLNVPILVTEQYPKGLGHTVEEVRLKLPAGTKPIEKMSFSACGVQEFDTQLRERHIEQVVVCGIEAHICVSQTAHDLLARGYQVHIVADAIGARLERNREIALRKLICSGAIIASVEMALFELCGTAGTPAFKTIQNLVKTLE